MDMVNYRKERETLAGKLFVLQKELAELEKQRRNALAVNDQTQRELKSLNEIIVYSRDNHLVQQIQDREALLTSEYEKAKVNLEKVSLEIDKQKKLMSETERELSMISRAEDLQREREKTLNELDWYRSSGTADQNAFAKQVKKAIGDRSMRQFAQEIGYNVSSISRIVNSKLQGQCSDEMIAAIAANAEEGSGVTVESLMEALGKERVPSYQGQKYEEIGKMIIRTELLNRGYTITEEIPEPFDGPAFQYRLDYCIKTDAVNGTSGKWCFEFKNFISGRAGINVMRQTLTMVMSAFYCGTMEADKVSLVINNPDIFNHIINGLSNIKVRDDISIILIENERVAQEYILSRTDNEERKSPFDKPVRIAEKEEFFMDDWDESIFDE